MFGSGQKAIRDIARGLRVGAHRIARLGLGPVVDSSTLSAPYFVCPQCGGVTRATTAGFGSGQKKGRSLSGWSGQDETGSKA